MERLGLGPVAIQEENPKVIYARLTGYGKNKILESKRKIDFHYEFS